MIFFKLGLIIFFVCVAHHSKNPSLNLVLHGQTTFSLAQGQCYCLQYKLMQLSDSKYNIPLKALLELKNTALGGVPWDKYTTRLCLMLYLSLNTSAFLYKLATVP